MTADERVSLSRGEDDPERRAIQNVRDDGVHILHIFDPEEKNPPFSYTVGLWHTHRHPEVLIFGLSRDLRQNVLNYLNGEIASGKSFRTNEHSVDVLRGFTTYFQTLPKTHYREHLGWDLWFYQGDAFEAVQMLWPNTSGVYPWDEQANEELRWMQPILTDLPTLQ